MNLPAALLLMLSAAFEPTLFQDANRDYADGDYAAAAERYERIIAGGVDHPVVFYNLANAYYRQGRIGAAIANYERALRINPGMENAQHNLAQAVARTDRRLPRPAPPRWERILLFWHENLSPGFAWTGALTAWCLLWGALALRAWRPLPRLGALAAICAVVAVALGLSAWAKSQPSRLAVAAAERVSARYGTSVTETVRFELHEGDRVLIDRQEGDWVRVMLENGDRGWVRRDGLVLVGPPYTPPATQTPSETTP